VLKTTSLECRKCGLCRNQPPLVHAFRGQPDAFFTGLSAVRTEDPARDEPFSLDTASGGLLREISGSLSTTKVYYTNLVKCLPLRGDSIRYPARSEMEFCFKHYRSELNRLLPRKVVLFGRQVAGFLEEKLQLRFRAPRNEFDFPVATVGNVEYLSTYHPSFVLVYKRRKLDLYKRRLSSFLEQ
jgi:uracil-DNA glycosylase